jgi:hypothetical protein
LGNDGRLNTLIEPASWRFAYASTQGRSHIAAGTPCQDSSTCLLVRSTQGSHLLIAAVSDGAGSASHSDVGSKLVCSSFADEMKTFVREQGTATPIDREQVEWWLGDFRRDVACHADKLGVTQRELACTFLGAVVSPTWSAFCQIGDGGIVVSASPGEKDKAEFELVFWPEQGEYANETYFATMDDVAGHLQFRVRDTPVGEVALFTDGLQRLVLNYDTRTAFAPFFQRMLQPVRRVDHVTGEARSLSLDLGAYLGSTALSDRTDDDVSLVLATQQPALAEADQPSSTAHVEPTLRPTET